MPDDFHLVEDSICWPLVQAVSISPDGPDDHFRRLTPEQQAYLAMWHLEAEVFNGGFFQFYINTGGWLAPHAMRGYVVTGLDQHAELVRRAIDIARRETEAGLPQPSVPAEGSPTARAFDVYRQLNTASQLQTLDNPWYDLLRRDDGFAAKARFVRDHPERFPTVESRSEDRDLGTS